MKKFFTKKISLKKLNLRVFCKEAYLFILAQVVGIVVGMSILTNAAQSKIDFYFPFWWFIVYFLVVSIIFALLTIYIKNTRYLMKIIFVVVLFSGAEIFFSTFFPELIATGLALLVVSVRFLYPTILFHDFTIILAIGGLCGVWGNGFSVLSVIILLLILSIYDYIAVYKTKHMIKMARKMMEYNVLVALIIPNDEKNYLLTFDKLAKKRAGFMILGGGDLALPMLLIVSVLTNYSIFHSLIVMIFSVLGLFMMHYIFNMQKIKKPMPALPPLAIFSILGFLLSLLLIK